jgi:hypothetical protein
VLLSAIWVAANVVWMGCVYIPLPARHQPVRPWTNSDVKAANKAKLSRDEVVAKLGSPDAYLSDLHIACYRVNTISKRDLVLFLLVIPLGTEDSYPGAFDLALIEFDETDHVKGYEFVRQDGGQSYEQAAKSWLALRAKPMGKH